MTHRRPWLEAELRALRSLYPDTDTEAIALTLRRSVSAVYGMVAKLGLAKSPEYIARTAGRRLTVSGAPTRFRRGQAPWNTGRKIGSHPNSRATQFKPRSKPPNAAAIGDTRLMDGYLQRKVTDTGYPPRDWKNVHVLLWEEHHGPVPPGHIVVFRDRNRAHIEIDNLELITRAENMRRNTIHRYPPELKDAIRVIGRVRKEIAHHEEQDR